MSDMERFTSEEYYAQCRAIAEECCEEAEGDENDAADKVHEVVDGHEWIIYTFYNGIVLEHSRNDGAHFENFGPLEADGYSDAMVKMAYAAMSQDVMEYLSEACEAYQEAHEGSDDE
jgi:hypothetical protein